MTDENSKQNQVTERQGNGGEEPRRSRRRWLWLLLLMLALIPSMCYGGRYLFPPKPVDPLRPKGESEGPVQLKGMKLYVDGKPFLVRGVGYNPIPIGQRPGSKQIFNSAVWRRDLPLLRKMGCNAIRTWDNVDNEAFLDACWNGGRDPIYVIMGYWISNDLDFSKLSVRQQIRNQYKRFVERFHRHPAVLFWALGNENNYWYKRSDISDWYTLANELAMTAYQVEGDDYHPVAIVNGLTKHSTGRIVGRIGSPEEKTDDRSMNYIDIWGVTYYEGYSFGNFFTEMEKATKKPVWIAEFGIDAWDNQKEMVDAEGQATWDLNQWRELAQARNCIGGTVMAYCDEWWKDEMGLDDTHDTGGYFFRNNPDHYSNEEWYGIMEPYRDKKGVDRMQPRAVYYALQKEWTRSAPR